MWTTREFDNWMNRQGVATAPLRRDPTPEYIVGLYERINNEERRRQIAERDAGRFLWEVRCWRKLCGGLAVAAVVSFSFACWAVAELWR